jgi:MoaA/NifB/PqqE/SkfB family radical SAM enzyme
MIKFVKSPGYNYLFNLKNGFFARWGESIKDDPDFSPLGPEILDIEVSTICNGGCTFCYKSNTMRGKNMSLETFKAIFHKMPKNLTQIAFGIGALDANPDLWKIMQYCRENDYNKVVPNITINGIDFTDEQADKLVSLCGAVAVSHYSDDNCFRAVKMLADRGLKQVNIHQLLCKETLGSCFKLMDSVKEDDRLSGLNAIVFLLMKPKGKRNKFHQLTSGDEYKRLIDYAFDKDIPIGFDSCSAPSFLKAVKDRDNYKKLEMLAEPCESDCFSSYINADGRFFHCSFTEGEDGWEGIDVLNCEDFMKNVWYSPEVNRFRGYLLKSAEECGCRSCPIFELDME